MKKKLMIALLITAHSLFGTTVKAEPVFDLSFAKSTDVNHTAWCLATLYEKEQRGTLQPEHQQELYNAAAEYAPLFKNYEDNQDRCIKEGAKPTEGGTEQCLRARINKKNYEAVRTFKNFQASAKGFNNVQLGVFSLGCLSKTEKEKRGLTSDTNQLNSKSKPTYKEDQSPSASELWLKQLDGNWFSKQWKYGYQLKNGVGTATATNSPNFQIGQKIIHLTAKSATAFVGQQVYTDGKFYNITVTLLADGRLYFEGEKNAKWYMER
jgi:hypothetical protein